MILSTKMKLSYAVTFILTCKVTSFSCFLLRGCLMKLWSVFNFENIILKFSLNINLKKYKLYITCIIYNLYILLTVCNSLCIFVSSKLLRLFEENPCTFFCGRHTNITTLTKCNY